MTMTIPRLVLITLATVASGSTLGHSETSDRLASAQQRRRTAVCFWNNGHNADVPWELCSHLVYSYAAIDGTRHTLRNANSSSGEGALDAFAAFKQRYPNLKLLLQIGNCSKDDANISSVASTAAFAREVLAWVDRYNLDGVLLTCCYPTSRQSDFVDIVKELRKALSKINRRTFIGLQLPISEQASRIVPGFNFTALTRLVDFIQWKTSSSESRPEDFVPGDALKNSETEGLGQRPLNAVTGRRGPRHMAPTFDGKECINDVCIMAGGSTSAISSSLIAASLLSLALFRVW